MSEQNIHRRFCEFEANLRNMPIADYFGVKPHNGNVKFTLTKKESHCIEFSVFFTKNIQYKSVFPNLPSEVNDLILSYVPVFIRINTNITFPTNYPFCPPRWELSDIDHNVHSTPVNLNEYYQYIIDNHNRLYKRSWSPAIKVEKDVLEFIQKINHFEYLVK